MAARKAESAPAGGLVVCVPFAYATTTTGEVRQLLKGDVVDPDKYDSASVDHLRSIGFLAEPE